MVSIVDTLRKNLEELLLVKILLCSIERKEYPKVLPRTYYRKKPKVTVELI